MLHLFGLCSDERAALDLATRHDGRSWAAHPSQRPGAPYTAMFAVACDDLDAASAVADVGLGLAMTRVIKPGPAPTPDRVIASFGMVRHPDLSHREADDHWRDIHGPVALRSHTAMCDYEQVSMLHTFHGPPLDGMAMCAFPDRDTLSTSFFNDDAAKAEVAADVATFADHKRSLPRVVLIQTR